jgi:4a-hydroxytetrahydrobiopterin dehydratase
VAVPAELKQRIASNLPSWQVIKKELKAKWRFPDFANALGATVRVAVLAERANHHPDLALGWGYLEVRLSSHDVGNITERDLALAEAIQAALGTPG